MQERTLKTINVIYDLSPTTKIMDFFILITHSNVKLKMFLNLLSIANICELSY